MPSHIAILQSDLPEHAGGIPATRARVAQAYGRLPPAALLLLAVATIRLMQWLYRYRVISEPATEPFFRTAKRLELYADQLVAWKAGRS